MRRLIAFAAFLLALSVIPVCAQRGGGHASSSGGHGGFSGGHASFGGGFSGGHMGGGFSGGHVGGLAGHSGFVSRGAIGAGSRYGNMGSGRFARGSHYYGGRRFGGGHFFDRRYRNRFAFGYPYYGYPFYSYLPGIDPYWWWDSYPSDDAEQRELANEMNEQNLDEQQALREQGENDDAGAYSRSSAPPRQQARQAQPSRAPEAQNDPKTVLIYRDQHQREVQNYAIVDDVIYVFTSQRTEKVPLAILDIPATQKANEDRGIDFHLPGV